MCAVVRYTYIRSTEGSECKVVKSSETDPTEVIRTSQLLDKHQNPTKQMWSVQILLQCEVMITQEVFGRDFTAYKWYQTRQRVFSRVSRILEHSAEVKISTHTSHLILISFAKHERRHARV